MDTIRYYLLLIIILYSIEIVAKNLCNSSRISTPLKYIYANLHKYIYANF